MFDVCIIIGNKGKKREEKGRKGKKAETDISCFRNFAEKKQGSKPYTIKHQSDVGKQMKLYEPHKRVIPRAYILK